MPIRAFVLFPFTRDAHPCFRTDAALSRYIKKETAARFRASTIGRRLLFLCIARRNTQKEGRAMRVPLW